ncbi:MAG TPA: DUF4037 domain-containing protein [Caulobacteraceae bacterium]|jgi:hypothetical protein
MPSGIELSRGFYESLVGPWLARAYPGLRHAAALVGYGSELLGFDDEMSQDHNWGPRVLLFVSAADFGWVGREVVEDFGVAAPATFHGVPIGWASREHPAPHANGGWSDDRHGLEVWTVDAFANHWLGGPPPADNLAWLGLAEQRLLSVTAGAVFRDDDGALTDLRARLASPPRDVALYKLACQWRRIGEEQAFVGRTGDRGDELGSRVIAARLARDGMRLAFLIEGRYAPYPKWFGSAFAQLPCAAELSPLLQRALVAADWQAREAALAEAYLVLAQLQIARGWPCAPPIVSPYHERPFTVINAEPIWQAVRAEIVDPALRALPVIGALDQVTGATAVIEAPARARAAMAALLDDGEPGALEKA